MHELVHASPIFRHGLGPEAFQEKTQFFLRGSTEIAELGLDAGLVGLLAMLDRFAEQIFLVFEIGVDGAFGDPGRLGDGFQARGVEAVARERVQRGFQQGAGALFGLALPTGGTDAGARAGRRRTAGDGVHN
jgi:hypothetical protein